MKSNALMIVFIFSFMVQAQDGANQQSIPATQNEDLIRLHLNKERRREQVEASMSVPNEKPKTATPLEQKPK